MNDLLVVMAASGIRGTMSTYLRQLSKGGIETLVLDVSSLSTQFGDSSMGKKLEVYRKICRENLDFQFLVFSDAFDVTFCGDKESVMARIPSTFVLQAAERNRHPPECLSFPIPDVGPWRYANGGLAAGTPESFLKWADACENHPQYDPNMIDQHFMNLCLATNYDCGWKIDHFTNLFFCLYGGHEELSFDGQRAINCAYGTNPLFIHANGGWPGLETE